MLKIAIILARRAGHPGGAGRMANALTTTQEFEEAGDDVRRSTLHAGRPIGGADRLARLDRRGVLAALAYGDPVPVTRVRKRRLRRAASCWVAEALDATGRRVGPAVGRDEESARATLARALRDDEPGRAT